MRFAPLGTVALSVTRCQSPVTKAVSSVSPVYVVPFQKVIASDPRPEVARIQADAS